MGFLGDLFGSSGRKDLQRANASASKSLKEGYDQAQGYYNQAYDIFTPLAQDASSDLGTYRQAIGLGTPEQQSTAQSRYFSDPAQQAIMGQQSNALLRQLNARGNGTGGGILAMAGARLGNEQYQGWLNRLQGLGGDAGQYATQQASIRSGQGDSAWGYGATRAGQAVNFGSAMAQQRNTGINNLLGIASLGVKAYTGMK